MYIDVNEDQIVTLDFSSYNSSRILDQFKKWNDKKKVYDENDIKKIEESLDMLGDVTKGFEVEANVNEVYIDEDDLRDETKGDYDEGFEDAMERVASERKGIYQVYGCLLQKLERLAYGYGNQKALTQDELKKIKEIIDDKA